MNNGRIVFSFRSLVLLQVALCIIIIFKMVTLGHHMQDIIIYQYMLIDLFDYVFFKKYTLLTVLRNISYNE